MGDYLEFTFDDGQKVLLEVFPSPSPGPGPDLEADVEDGFEADDEDDDGPYGDGPGRLVPVAGGRRAVRTAGRALTSVLAPLVPVLQSVHATVAAVRPQPETVSVELAVKIGSDLKLGIVSGVSEASFAVTATWRAAPAGDAPETPESP